MKRINIVLFTLLLFPASIVLADKGPTIPSGGNGTQNSPEGIFDMTGSLLLFLIPLMIVFLILSLIIAIVRSLGYSKKW